MSIRIGISKASGSPKYMNYSRWIQGTELEVEVIDFSISDNLLQDLSTVDGVILSGGEDIDPERYHQPEDRSLCGDIDPNRDVLEFTILEVATSRNLPILGICRGLQVLNVFYGGTLYTDIPTSFPGNHTHPKVDTADAVHSVDVESGSLLLKATGMTSGMVNSAHHQALHRIGDGLIVSATAEDGIVEAIEWQDRAKPYLLGVQWHPERMTDQSSPFSDNIRKQFLFEAESFKIAQI